MSDFQENLQRALGEALHIERELGGGGMSRVFLAEETALGRRVVVKVLPEDLSGSISLARFRREIALAARLQHPHIVPLIAAGEVDGLPYYTMPFVDGESLRARLAHGELPVAAVVSLLRDVAKALEYAHAKGVTHRDIKPDNVLIAGTSAVITDFGVAKAVSDASEHGQLTSVGIALGTPAYMSPEQAAADPATDIRADIYAFGAMSYEMLAGHPPFAGRSAQATLAAHATEAPVSIGAVRPATPPALVALVMQCLEKRPGDRPQNAGELLDSLDAVDTSAATSRSRIQNAATEVMAAKRPASRFSSLTAIIAVSVIVLAAGALWWSRRSGSTAVIVRSLAVMPFENRSRDTSFDYLEDGITDHVRDALNAMPELAVKARRSSIVMKGSTASQIGAKLGVAAVLLGTVSRNGARLHVTTELVSTADDNALMSMTFDGDADAMLLAQDSITRSVVRRLGLHGASLVEGAAGSRGTNDAVAYDHFLRGRFARDRFQIARAQEEFQAAVTRDPGFARGYAFLSLAYADNPVVGAASLDSSLNLARRAADKAIALDSSLAEAYLAQAYIVCSDYMRLSDGIKLMEKALAIDSSNVDALYDYGMTLAQLGRLDEGLVQVRRAHAKDPLRVKGLVGKLLGMAHQYDAAMAEVHATLALDPNHTLAYRELGVLYAFTGRPDSSVAAFEHAYSLAPRAFGDGANLVWGYAAAGRWRDAERQRAINARAGYGNSPNYYHVVEGIAFGDYDSAMTALDRGVSSREQVFLTMSIPCDPIFDALKSNPKFTMLMQRIGARACPASPGWPIRKPAVPIQ